jgi:hypothetical protein
MRHLFIVVRLPLAIVVAVAMLAGSCSSGATDITASETAATEAVMYGEWLTTHGTTMSYDEDGTWTAQHASTGLEPFDWGTYTFDGELLTYSTDSGSLSCQEGQTGVYEAALTNDGSLSLKRVEDPCSGRSSDLFGGMVRKSS